MMEEFKVLPPNTPTPFDEKKTREWWNDEEKAKEAADQFGMTPEQMDQAGMYPDGTPYENDDDDEFTRAIKDLGNDAPPSQER